MQRATDAELYLEPPCLSITIVSNGAARSPAVARFAIATFEAPEGGPYRGPTPPSYQGLCGRTRLLAVPSLLPAAGAVARPGGQGRGLRGHVLPSRRAAVARPSRRRYRALPLSRPAVRPRRQ